MMEHNGFEYVDLGLSVNWATMNVGANDVLDSGLYFMWGDTVGYTKNDLKNGAKWFDNMSYILPSKYSSPLKPKKTLDLEDDAARVNMGGSWRMPTSTEFQELLDATTSAWTNDYQGSGVNGRLFTDKTDNSKVLFFPAAGGAHGRLMYNVGFYGYVWSSSIYTSNITNACYLGFYSGSVGVYDYYRYYGFSVRGVVAKGGIISLPSKK